MNTSLSYKHITGIFSNRISDENPEGNSDDREVSVKFAIGLLNY